MSKPIREITITTAEGVSAKVAAVFDTGSFYTIIRADVLPPATAVIPYREPKNLGTAGKGGRVSITGETILVFEIGDKMISGRVLISPQLSKELLLGAETMQSWDISILNKNGSTQITIGHDMRDPDITEVD